MANLATLDTIANLIPIARDRLMLVEPEYQALQQLPVGQVGTILEIYPGEPPQYLVEFADRRGSEYAVAILHPHELLALHYELVLAS